MSRNGSSSRWRWPILLLCSLLVLLAIPFVAVYVVFRPDDITETKMKVGNMNGADIEVTYTNSDGLAKSEWVDVYFSTAGWDSSLLKRLTTKKTLIFRYDPAGALEPLLPQFRELGPSTVSIEVPRISSVIEEKRRWNNLAIEYNIERVDYP